MISPYQITEHTLECQHIREYAKATSGAQEDVLHLSIKQYSPIDNLAPRKGDITIIAAHANGFPKELYEPLWNCLKSSLQRKNLRIRGIWIADVAHQGSSGLLNAGKLGNDPSWFDHSRDLLLMVNRFRAQMPRPIIGIGHSMGACQLTHFSLMHPRILSGLVLLEPMIQPWSIAPVGYTGPLPVRQSAFRRDSWASMESARDYFISRGFYQQWHPDVLQCWLRVGLHEHANRDSDDGSEEKVSLTTTKEQEIATFLRPRFDIWQDSDGEWKAVPIPVPDAEWEAQPNEHFYRPEPIFTYRNLSHVRPPVLYILGDGSAMSEAASSKLRTASTGTGVGGSGGQGKGKVEEIRLARCGHLLPMEAPEKAADSVAQWLAKQSVLVRQEEEAARTDLKDISEAGNITRASIIKETLKSKM